MKDPYMSEALLRFYERWQRGDQIEEEAKEEGMVGTFLNDTQARGLIKAMVMSHNDGLVVGDIEEAASSILSAASSAFAGYAIYSLAARGDIVPMRGDDGVWKFVTKEWWRARTL